MDPKLFPEKKTSIIADNSLDELSEFLRRIPRADLEECLGRIPLRGGFHGESAIKQRIKILHKELKDPKAKNFQFSRKAMTLLWVRWVSSSPLNQPLKAYDNKADIKNEPNTETDIKCFEYLLEQAQTFKISQTLVSTFYKFGYFLPDEKIDSIIEKFPVDFSNESSRKESVDVSETQKSDAGESLRLRVLKEQTSELRAETRKLTEQVSGLGVALDGEKGRATKNERLIENLKNRIKEQDDQQKSNKDELTVDIKKINQSLKDLDNFSETLESRIEVLEKRVSDLGAKLQGAKSSTNDFSNLNPVRSIPSHGKIKEVKTIDLLLELLTNNFYECGLQGKPSMTLARDTLAALAVGQVPLFSGSFANELARAAAITFSKGHAQLFEVSVDSINGNVFHAAFSSFFDNGRDHGSLVVEGANRAPVEIYGTSLLEAVRSNMICRSPFTKVVFGVLTPLPGGLPLTTQLTELGPIFETDCFSWREPSSEITLTPGEFMASTNLDEILGHHFDDNIDDCRRKIDRIGSVSWKTIINDAYKAVHAIPGSEDDTPISGLVCGWIIPRAISSGLSSNEVQTVVNQYFGDEISKSHRIRKTISLMSERWL